ncbi:MAG TPA: zinc-ribbon domain-containing protein [Euryarchaeota archaeon]|nr:zinc-ribbon domain-containing protein [Euryarchaeota archaeon]
MGAGMAQAVQVGMQPQADNPWEDKDSAGSMKCPKCGAEVKPGERFCGKCGHQLVKESTCVKCKKPIEEGVKFCPHCGAKQTLECPKCGKEVASGTKFCPECGTELQQ